MQAPSAPRHLRTAVIAAGFILTAALAACGGGAVDVGYRFYDPYYSDYHVWGPDEAVYYNRWLDETHRKHREFNRLPDKDRHVYYTWRHAQPAAPGSSPRSAPAATPRGRR